MARTVTSERKRKLNKMKNNFIRNYNNVRLIWTHAALSNIEQEVPEGASITFMSPLGAVCIMNKHVANFNNLNLVNLKNKRAFSKKTSKYRSTYTYRHPEKYIDLWLLSSNGRRRLSSFIKPNTHHYVIACRLEGKASVNQNMITRHLQKEGGLVTHIVNNEIQFANKEILPVSYWNRVAGGVYKNSIIPRA